MSPEQKAEVDKYLNTKEGREKLAASMIQPFRCGGLDYIDGVPCYRTGGYLVPKSVLDQSRKENNGNPWPGIRAYQATHEPYTPRPRGRKEARVS